MEPNRRDRKPQNEEKSAALPICMCLGMAIGTAVGAATGNMAMWMSLGAGLGVALGASMDAAGKKSAPSEPGEKGEDEE